jgi:phage terminase small subunit
MPRQRDPRRDEAFEIWKQNKGDITNREIADRLDVPEKTISAWKSRDKWNVVLQKKERSTAKKMKNKLKPKNSEIDESLLSDDLTDKQRLFCVHYLKNFNATQAAIKAGYASDSAHVEGSRLLRHAKVGEYIKEIKADMTNTLFLDAMDVLRKYAEIAFADITDFVSFGTNEVSEVNQITGEPLLDDDGNQVTRTYNYVDFKSSSEVDGTIITEVKQGREGVSIKLADKMRALDILTKYFDLIPDHFKRRIEEEKLKLAKQKASGEGDSEDQLIDDWVESVMDSEEDE